MDAKAYIKQQEERDLELLSIPAKQEEKKQGGKTRDAVVRGESSSEDEGNGSDKGEEGASSSDDGEDDIEFPRNNAADLLQFLHRELNNL